MIMKWWCFPIEFQKYVFELLKTTQGSRFCFDQTENKSGIFIKNDRTMRTYLGTTSLW